MLGWIFDPRMILLPFAFGLWLLAWSIRLLPARDSLGKVRRAILGLTLGAATSGAVIGEVILYRMLTGGNALKDDHFFIAFMIVECLIGTGLVFKSDAVLKRKESQATLDK